MNIVYISKLEGERWQGPNQSVPRQIKAQSKYDNVFWYNINNVKKPEWCEQFECNNLSDYYNIKIKDLPSPFNKPDLVVFEGVYEYPFCKIIYEIWKMKIPYIIIPRSALTNKAQESKKLKKKIGNIIFFKKFIRKAIAIQYLTENELIDSGYQWNRNNIIIPNGIDKQYNIKIDKQRDVLKGIFIGRVDTYQKGLDLLLESCSRISDDLKAEKCIISLYGPDRNNSKINLYRIIKEKKLEGIIEIKDAVFDEQKREKLLDSDFFIMTSRFEGHPMALIEALSYGLPCFITKGTNMLQVVKEYNAGWCCENNIESISENLKLVLENKHDLYIKGRNAKLLSEQYDWNEIAKLSNQKYKQLLSNDIKNEKTFIKGS